MADFDWTAATDRALASVEGQTDGQASEQLGVSESTFRRWRVMREEGEPIPEPRGGPREALLRFMQENGNGTPPPRKDYGAGMNLNADGLAELYRRIDAIEAENIPWWAKVMRMDALAATVRGEAYRADALAASERAKAMSQDGVAGQERAKAAREEAEASKVRAMNLPQQRRKEKEPPSSVEDTSRAVDSAFPTEGEDEERRAGGNRG